MGTSVKTNKAIFLGISAIMAVIALIRGELSAVGIVVTVVLVGICAYLTVHRDGTDTPAARNLPLYAPLPLAGFVMGRFGTLGALATDTSVTEGLGARMSEMPLCSGLVTMGVICAGASLAFKRLPWLLGVGGGLLGSGLIMALWGVPVLEGDGIVMHDGGRAVLAAYVLWSAYLTAMLCASVASDATVRMRALLITALAFLVTLIINVGYQPYLASIASDISSRLLMLGDTSFSWWRVVVCCMVLVALAFAMQDDGGFGIEGWLGTDSAVACVAATWVLAIRVLLSAYFVYSWLLMLVFMVATLWLLARNVQKKPVLGLGATAFLGASMLTFVLMVLLLWHGLVPNAVVTAAFIVLVCAQRERLRKDGPRTALWVGIVSLLVSEALAFQALRHFTPGAAFMLVGIWGVATGALAVINRPHPNGVVAHDLPRAVICVCVAILCALTLRSGMHVSAEATGDEVRVGVEPADATSTYVWYDSQGHPIAATGDEEKPDASVVSESESDGEAGEANGEGAGETTDEAAAESDVASDGVVADDEGADTTPRSIADGETVPIESDVLVITTTDPHGAQRRSLFFYPSWLHSFGEVEVAEQPSEEAASVEEAPTEAESVTEEGESA